MTVQRSGDDLALSINGTDDRITVESWFAGDSGEYRVEQILFDDGTTFDADAIMLMVLQGTSGDDVLMGYSTSDTISGFAGSDRLYGLEDDDILDGGSGNDTLFGGSEEEYWDSPTITNGNDVLPFRSRIGAEHHC